MTLKLTVTEVLCLKKNILKYSSSLFLFSLPLAMRRLCDLQSASKAFSNALVLYILVFTKIEVIDLTMLVLTIQS